MRGSRAGLVGAVLLATTVGWFTTPATAGSFDCTYNPKTKTVRVQIDTSGADVVEVIRAGNEIHGGGLDCGGTRFNTDKIVVDDSSSSGNSVEIIISLAEGDFNPGAKDEPGKSDEIEFELNLYDGANQLRVKGGQADDFFTAGTPGAARLVVDPVRVNLNSDEGRKIDSDLRVVGELFDLILEGRGGEDVIDVGGGAGAPGPYEGITHLKGGRGEDRLLGGAESDHILGGAGPDSLKGRAASDDLYGEAGSDRLDGGSNSDLCDGGPGQNTLTNCEL